MIEIVQATAPSQIEQVRTLFSEYRAELAVDACFDAFDAEMASLPGCYASPAGLLLLASVVGQPVGCVGLRPFPTEGACEMKRLYVRPPFRGDKIGRKLAEHLIAEARRMRYSAMRLDSHPPTMQSAIAMYRKLGFQEISSEPLPVTDGLIYMQLMLSA